MKKRFFTLLICILIFAALLCGCSRSDQNAPVKKQYFALDTVIDITVYGDKGEEAAATAYKEIKRLEGLFSVTDKSSDIFKINSSGGRSVKVQTDTIELLTKAKEISEDTEGDFDITVYPLVEAWGFTTDDYRVLADSEVKKLLPLTDWKKVAVDKEKSTVKIEKGMEVDLGAIAKGYIAEKVKEAIKNQGVSSAVISLGGNVTAMGEKPDGGKWSIAVTDPFNAGATFCSVKTEEASIITSGNYQRFFERNGVKYHHIIDPKTGKPANSGLVSATVITDDPVLGDALSTAFFIKGKNGAKELASKYDKVDFILMDENKNIYVSKGLADNIELAAAYKDSTVTVL